jgi:very-short-patch-repair endonuclease
MALQIATCLPSEFAVATLDSALHKGMLRVQDIRVALADSSFDLSDVLNALDARSESGLESLCRIRLSRMGLPTRSQVFIDGVGRVDLVVGDRLVIEADGQEWHDSPGAFASDRKRDLRLALLGYSVLRLTYAQIIHEWPLVELSIRAMIARREHVWV